MLFFPGPVENCDKGNEDLRRDGRGFKASKAATKLNLPNTLFSEQSETLTNSHPGQMADSQARMFHFQKAFENPSGRFLAKLSIHMIKPHENFFGTQKTKIKKVHLTFSERRNLDEILA